ncbi:hypothetical protein L0Y40_02915 [Candidatus Wolfebacteria bacterium]|nr:hypothetical protein [Candidatus Wolfebacteria bacterium]
METLAKLFSSGTLVKIMRLFLFHPTEAYDADDLARKTKSGKKSILYETKLLTDVGFLKQAMFSKKVMKTVGRKRAERSRRVKGWALDESFPYLSSLKTLLVNTDLMNKGELEQRLSQVGRLKLIVVSGVFMQEDQQIDLLLVGERIRYPALASAIKAIESAIGTEVRYAIFPPDEFEYRMGVRDRLLRDVFDYPHLVVKNSFRKSFSSSSA